jgi:Pro-kumamolisin, activation domain
MNAANDRGPVADDCELNHMYLLLNRSPEQEQAVENLVNELHDEHSRMYHQWLTSDQVAQRFGPSEEDVQTVSSWLESQGFAVNSVYLANGVIDFSGPASAIRRTSRTPSSGPTRPIGAPLTALTTVRRSPTFRNFRGMTLAQASSSPWRWASLDPTGRPVLAIAR